MVLKRVVKLTDFSGIQPKSARVLQMEKHITYSSRKWGSLRWFDKQEFELDPLMTPIDAVDKLAAFEVFVSADTPTCLQHQQLSCSQRW